MTPTSVSDQGSFDSPDSASLNQNDRVQPQAKSRRWRKADRARRGLPNQEDLAKLVQVYLTNQCRQWPSLVGSPLLPADTDQSRALLAEQFANYHISGQVPSPDLASLPSQIDLADEATPFL